MIAPRALLVISASRDALQFSVGEAAKSISHASGRYRLLGAEAKIRHVTIESGHDYNKPMREAMYGWVEKWLCGRGDGGPIHEPEFKVEEIECAAMLRQCRFWPLYDRDDSAMGVPRGNGPTEQVNDGARPHRALASRRGWDAVGSSR